MVYIARFISMPHKLFTSIVLILILLGQIYELLYYINKTNRSLSHFLDAIKDKDYSAGSNIELVDESFRSLNQSFKNIAQTIFDSKLEKEAQFHLLNLIIDKVQTGILLINCEDEKVSLMNQSAVGMLNLNQQNSLAEIKSKIPEISKLITTQFAGKKVVELDINHKKHQFLLHSNPVILVSKQYILITFSNIQEELDRKEIQSWQKLLRTLSHEIMNSVTPILSLTETSLTQVQNNEGKVKEINDLNSGSIEKIQRALTTIEKRSAGLYQFVDDFRKLAKVPEPAKKVFSVGELFDSVSQLMIPELKKESVQLNTFIQNKDIAIDADFALIEQVLINLIINSKDACAKVIELCALQAGNNIFIEVKDNGNGIPNQKINEIFVPFFTTKKKGSGIGLSLSRQIMQLHGGNITVKSTAEEETVFTLQF